MPIFKIKNSKLELIKEKSVGLEKNLHKLTEGNLKIVFGYEFVASEFKIQNFYIDTLAYDSENKSFVIIEYKKDKNFSVIDQGYAYLGAMLNNKADFILEYNEKMKTNLKRGEVDWSQSKVIFVSTQFTPYQQNAISFKDLPIELWEVTIYDNNTILYNQLKSPEAKESIKTISKGKVVSEVSKEIKTYTVEDHLAKKPKQIIDLYNRFKDSVLNIDDNITEIPKKFYIAFRGPRINFVSFHIFKSKLKIHIIIDKKALNDPKSIVKEIPKSYGWAPNLKEITFRVDDDFDYVMDIIKQAYEFNKDR